MDVAAQTLYMFSQPYYALHSIVFFSYFIARHAAATYSTDQFRQHLFRRELQTTLSLCVLLCLKWRRSLSLEAILGDGLFYGKALLLLLSAALDWRLAAWYMMIFAAIFLLFPQPAFKGLGNVVQMTPLQLETQLAEGNPDKIWLVEFRAVWSAQCVRASRVFTNLSMRYSTTDLYFGSIDLGRFPKADALYGLSLEVNKGSLPTYIMFKGGIEISRLSTTETDGTITSRMLSEDVITTYFELDRHLLVELDKICSKRVIQ